MDTYVDEIQVATFNTWLMPIMASVWIFDTAVSWRAKRVANFINTRMQSDILLLQEVWTPQGSNGISTYISAVFVGKLIGRGAIERTALHPYSTQPTTIPYWAWASWLTGLDSGLIISSKWPIEKEHYVRFTDSSAEDSMAAKGVLIAYTNKMLVLNTHMNAGTFPEERAKQILQLKEVYLEFREQLKAENCTVNKVIIGGDFNIDGASPNEESIEEYSNLVNVMGSIGLTDAVGTSLAFDSKNDISTDLFKHIGATSIADDGVTPTRLDMIFTNAKVKSVEAMWKKSDPPALYHPEDPDMVSDHAPVVARLASD